jgi:hypothetical protein
MRSRYDYLLPGNVQDEDKDFYPDVLSLSYDQGLITQIPTSHIVTEADLTKFWKYMWEKYELVELDDIFLNINGCCYLGILQPGSELYEPIKDDLTGFITTKKPGEDPS